MVKEISEFTVKDFKKRYDIAIKEEEQQFTFDSYDFLTSYAGYMIEYFNMIKVNDDILFDRIVKKD